MWIKVRLRRRGSQNERVISAYANGGFRAGKPTIVLPASLAGELGFEIERGRLTEGLVAGGLSVQVRELGQVEVKVEVSDREAPWRTCEAIYVEGEQEALMSRELIGLLGIELFYHLGKWRLADDEPGVLREEAEPERFE